MRKKLKMRAGGSVKKYAEGGDVHAGRGQRRQEDRAATAAEAAAVFDEEEARIMARRNAPRPSLITNAPVGDNNADRARGVRRGARVGMPPRPPEDVDGTGTGAAARPVRTPAARPPRRGQTRSREMSADELNDISLGLARGTRMGPLAPGAERNMAGRMGVPGYKKGGRVAAKKK